MKVAHKFCDFCGAVIKDGDPHATMTVPASVDSIDPSQLPSVKKKRAKKDAAYDFMAFSIVGLMGGEAEAGTAYDICLGCARSFLVARFSALKRAADFMRAQVEP